MPPIHRANLHVQRENIILWHRAQVCKCSTALAYKWGAGLDETQSPSCHERGTFPTAETRVGRSPTS